MESSLSCVAATPEQELLNDRRETDKVRTQDGCPQSVSDPPTYCIRAAGVLRYNRESDHRGPNLTTILSLFQPVTEYPVTCEYCGEKPTPPLDLQDPETTLHFCCTQRKQLWQMLSPRTGSLTTEEDRPGEEDNLLLCREMEDHNKSIMDLHIGLGSQSEQKAYEDSSIHLPAAETAAPAQKVLRFRLSTLGEGWSTVGPSSTKEKCSETKEEEEQVLFHFCDHKPIHFGLCHHQEGTGVLQKFYSNGVKFLTAFPDGSAQVFYPSGILALIVVVTERNGRVCIVYDDSDAPSQRMRALFQSDGRATCCHGNGNIWLHLNRSGGLRFDDAGARVFRWRWGSLTSFHPIFLTLNKAVGVRVLTNKQVFVSFLAKGQQAKFNVGACCAQDECERDASESPVLKEELFLSAAKIKIHMTIQNIHQCLKTPSLARLPKITLPPHLQADIRRLREVSPKVSMSDSDREFIRSCLKDC